MTHLSFIHHSSSDNSPWKQRGKMNESLTFFLGNIAIKIFSEVNLLRAPTIYGSTWFHHEINFRYDKTSRCLETRQTDLFQKPSGGKLNKTWNHGNSMGQRESNVGNLGKQGAMLSSLWTLRKCFAQVPFFNILVPTVETTMQRLLVRLWCGQGLS